MDTYHKAKAGTILQNLFDLYNENKFITKIDSYLLSQDVIIFAWDQQPHLYDGTFGKRPHELALAASALAASLAAYKKNSGEFMAILISLNNILNEIGVNGELYCFEDLDKKLIAEAMHTALELSKYYEQ